MSLLELQGLSVAFGEHRVLSGVTWSLEEGGCLGLVGESGSGKSLTALAILGLLPVGATVAQGQVRFEGRELLGLPEADLREIRGARISMVFQEPFNSLNPVMRVGEQVAEVLVLHRGMGKAQALAEASAWLGRVGIPEPESRSRQYPHQFSGGMRQRAMIAMAMACRPRLLIADEPTTALDVTVQAQILKLLKELSREFGVALLMISHDLGVIHFMADTVVVMRSGAVVEQGSRDQVFMDPQHAYTKELMQSYLSWAGA
jgi:ABC-type microcin C transport system duplicated ATPase subunit YejF